MKRAAFVLTACVVLGAGAPAHAQLGGLSKLKGVADKAADAKQKYDDYNINDKEERQLGEQVSMKLRYHFGVFQDANVTRYVSLVGGVLAQASSRPGLDWKFIVLDTDGVNAYAAPGGFVHITRGLLGLIKNEAQLAGVLGHEITHVTDKHTIKAIQQGKLVSATGEALGGGGSMRDQFIGRMSAVAFNKVFAGEFSQKDETDADKVGIVLANKVGYSPKGLIDVLQAIDARNNGRDDRNGMFASHPATKDRIEKLQRQVGDEKLMASATVATRYKQYITFDAKPASQIATDVSGAAGLASGDKKKADDNKDDPPKKKGLASGISGGKQTQESQQTASAGSRGLGGVPDRDATGGPNKNALTIRVTPAEIAAFKKGIVA